MPWGGGGGDALAAPIILYEGREGPGKANLLDVAILEAPPAGVMVLLEPAAQKTACQGQKEDNLLCRFNKSQIHRASFTASELTKGPSETSYPQYLQCLSKPLPSCAFPELVRQCLQYKKLSFGELGARTLPCAMFR